MIIYLGSNPSQSQKLPLVPFSGTRSGVILEQWKNEIGIRPTFTMNVSNSPTPNNRPLTVKEIKEAIPMLQSRIMRHDPVAVITLGKAAEKAYRMSGLRYPTYALPHPSGLNRRNNNKQYIASELKRCREFLIEVSDCVIMF